jgi:tetratricopeptide (TPR) repeat protein
MAQSVLVKQEITPAMIAAGKRVLKYLDEAGLDVVAALWLFTGEYSTCRLVLAMSIVREAGLKQAYMQLQAVLRNSPHVKVRLDDIQVIDSDRALEKVRYDSQYNDAYIYRLPLDQLAQKENPSVDFQEQSASVDMKALETKKVKSNSLSVPISRQKVLSYSIPPFSTYDRRTFAGRNTELADLTEHLQEGCRLLLIYGMAGIGKTALAERLAADKLNYNQHGAILPYRQVFLDRTLISNDTALNFNSIALMILGQLGENSAQQLPDNQILPYLLQTLKNRPCWLQLDSLEAVLKPTEKGNWAFTDPAWLVFLEQFLITSSINSSQLVITSQVLPQDWDQQGLRLDHLWKSYYLGGLAPDQHLELFARAGVIPQTQEEEKFLCKMTNYFDGHPLILKMIAGDIQNKPFQGNVERYWYECYQPHRMANSSINILTLRSSLEEKVRRLINDTLAQLPNLPRELLQRGSVFRRSVPERFYHLLASDLDLSETSPEVVLTILVERNLVEEQEWQGGEWWLGQHNLIREVAYRRLREKQEVWQMVERRAADLWLSIYEPRVYGSNWEQVQGYLEAFKHYCEVEDWEAAKNLAYTKLPTGNQLHWQLLIWGYFRELIPLHSKLLTIARKIRDRFNESTALNNLGRVYDSLSNYQQAIDLYQESLTITQEIGDRLGEGTVLRNLGNAYYRLGNYQQAINLYQESLTIARDIGDRQGEGAALGNLGNAYNSLGNYQQAIDFLQQRLTIARDIGDRQGEGNALGNLGNTYNRLGNYQQAIDFLQQHLTIARDIGDRQGEGAALGNLGNAYNSLGNYQQAIDFYQQYLTIARDIGDRQGEGNALCGLGIAYNRLGNYQQAIDFLQQYLTIARDIGDRQGEGIALGNLGNAYNSLGNYQQAIDFLEQYLTIARDIGDRQGEGIALVNMGETLLKLEQYTDALTNNQSALKIFQEIGDRANEAAALKNLAEVHQALGDLDLARQLAQQALKLSADLGIPLQTDCEALLAKLG